MAVQQHTRRQPPKDLRLLHNLMVIALLIGFVLNAGQASANNNMVTAWSAEYPSGGTRSCNDCHAAGSGALGLANDSEYATRLYLQLGSPASVGTIPVADVRTAMRNIQDYFAGSVSTLQAQDAGGTTLSTISSPDGNLTLPSGTEQLRITFGLTTRPFFTPVSGDGTTTLSHVINSPGFTNNRGLTISGGNNVFVIPLPSAETRRAARQASSFPYQLDFDPITSQTFRNRTNADVTNDFNLVTQNFIPVAANDGFNPVLSEVQDGGGAAIPYAMNVLTAGVDRDPDHAAAVLTVSPATPTLSAAYGTVARNGANNGYVYTAPAVLDPSPRTLTFTYSAVDQEGGVSNAATVTIVVPAAAPPPPPKVFVANNDLFTLDEGTSLTNADVKLDNGNGADDLDGAALVDVTFSTISSVASGSLSFAADGTFDYTPVPGFAGDVTFTYRLSDGSSFDDATVTLRMNPVNDAPIATPIDLVSRNETQDSFTEDLLNTASVTDADGDTLSVSNVTFAIAVRPASSSLTFNPGNVISRNGSLITIDPTDFAALDNDEFADITVTYDVSDGIAAAVSNTMSVTIVGLDNGLGRQAGAYADTLSSRYQSAELGAHFRGQASAPGACLTCHATIAVVGADVDSVDECVQTPSVFTAYGLAICLDRDANTPALTDLVRRLRVAEDDYGPSLSPVATIEILESAAPGASVGAPMRAASAGKNVFGLSSQIVTYLIGQGQSGAPSATDPSGQFRIADNGQITVAAPLQAGTYTLVVLPVNDAGQRDNVGNRISAPGFFKQNPGADSFVTIEVLPNLPSPVDDQINAETGSPLTINVLANDTGGAATQLTIVTPPANGTAVVNGDLTVTYTATGGFTGVDSFSYSSRNAAGVAIDTATVTITVLGTDALLAFDDTVTVVEGRATIIDVLANDRNVRRTGAQPTQVSITNAPDPDTVGTASVTGQSITFTPVAGFTGTTSMTYFAQNQTDNGLRGSAATVSINVLSVGSGLIAAAVTDPELSKVAQSFDQSCGIVRNLADLDAETEKFLDTCASLTVAAAANEDLTQAMRALRNEEHFAAVDATMTVARGLGRVVNRRLTQIRDGAARGFSTDGVTLRIGDQVLPSSFVAQAARAFMGLGTGNLESPDWGLFIAGDIAWVDRDPSPVSDGYALEAGNLMIGYDQQLSALRSVGFALGYSNTDTDFADGGSLSSKGAQATFYGVQKDFIRRDLTLEGFVSVGQMSFASDRRIRFTNGGRTVDTFASAEFNGTYANIVPKLSYSRVLGDYNDPIGAPRTATRVTWSTSLDYLWMNLDDYAETGGDGLGLNTQSDSYSSLILAFGVDASRPVFLGEGIRSELYGGIDIRGELLDRDRNVSSAYVAAGPGGPRFLVTEDGTFGLGAGFEIGMLIGFGAGGQMDVSYGYDYAGGGTTTQHFSFGFSREVFGQDALSLNVTRNFGGISSGGTSAEFDYSFRF